MNREAVRQQMLLRALGARGADDSAVHGWLRDEEPAAGLRAYRTNAGAVAERALATAFPTIAQLVGDESFAALARAYWQAEPPMRGDLAWFGEGLPGFIERSAQLADEPCLADCARLDWAVHRAEASADAPDVPSGLELLASHDPAELALTLRPGTAVVASLHPLVTIWLAHRSDAPDRFEPVRAAFAAGRGESALVFRRGWPAVVEPIDPADARFTVALLEGAALAPALQRAGDDFAFEPWLLRALRDGWLLGARPL